MLYYLLIGVVANGEIQLGKVDIEPMSYVVCEQAAQEWINQGFDIAVCRPIEADNLTETSLDE